MRVADGCGRRLLRGMRERGLELLQTGGHFRPQAPQFRLARGGLVLQDPDPLLLRRHRRLLIRDQRLLLLDRPDRHYADPGVVERQQSATVNQRWEHRLHFLSDEPELSLRVTRAVLVDQVKLRRPQRQRLLEQAFGRGDVGLQSSITGGGPASVVLQDGGRRATGVGDEELVVPEDVA